MKTIKMFKLLSVLVLSVPMLGHATTFQIKNGSKLYNAQLDVAECEKDECSGRAKILLYKKGRQQVFQILTSENLNFYLDKQQQPSVNVIQLYNEQSPLIFEDFNFDGQQDLAIRNGNESSYGGPSYDVYVFNKTRQKFVISDELTALVTENLGMFQTDAKRKRLMTFAKSGCCFHVTSEYAVIPNKGLKLVYEVTEDAMGGEQVKVTTKTYNLSTNKWQTTVKKYPIDDYYQ
ncbi:XAC2610-related protein [Alkanindiges illinoisensis]|uniref:XAC2610-related protein n=1 Tax=Alkanindiges illinoisensis TaxID=197183 RepID=UPI000479ED04|nr:FG-GAP repeat protein [Alkanindiges illinoisensis]